MVKGVGESLKRWRGDPFVPYHKCFLLQSTHDQMTTVTRWVLRSRTAAWATQKFALTPMLSKPCVRHGKLHLYNMAEAEFCHSYNMSLGRMPGPVNGIWESFHNKQLTSCGTDNECCLFLTPKLDWEQQFLSLRWKHSRCYVLPEEWNVRV